MDLLNEIYKKLKIYPHLIWNPDFELLQCGLRTEEEWIARGTSKPIQGFASMTFGLTAICVYIITLAVITNREYLQYACIKMMYFISICDMSNLFIANVVTGYFLIVGANFCTHPRVMYFFGGINIGSWGGMNVAATSLAIGRLVEITDSCRWLFRDSIVKFWIALAVAYFFFFAFFTYPTMFNSTEGVWLFAPFIHDNITKELAIFNNDFYQKSVYCMVTFVTAIYICLFAYLIYLKSQTTLPLFTKLERSLLIQCTLICLLSNLKYYFYAAVHYLAPGAPTKYVAQMLYQVSPCGPLLGYLIFNDSIRRRFLNVLCYRTLSHVMVIAPIETTMSSDIVDRSTVKINLLDRVK